MEVKVRNWRIIGFEINIFVIRLIFILEVIDMEMLVGITFVL